MILNAVVCCWLILGSQTTYQMPTDVTKNRRFWTDRGDITASVRPSALWLQVIHWKKISLPAARPWKLLNLLPIGGRSFVTWLLGRSALVGSLTKAQACFETCRRTSKRPTRCVSVQPWMQLRRSFDGVKPYVSWTKIRNGMSSWLWTWNWCHGKLETIHGWAWYL